MSSHHRHPSESPFKWRFTGGPMMARLYSGIWILPSKKKTLASWTPSGDTFWIRAWAIYNAPSICNHCFTPAPEQDGDIHSLVNVLFLLFHCPHHVEEMSWFDRHRQTWQCSIKADCGDELSWFPASCPDSVVVTMGNFRHKVKVLDIPLGWGVVTNN